MENRISEEDLQAVIGAIVESIESENFIRVFTVEEQLALGIDISRELKIIPYISDKALDLAQSISDYNGAITRDEIEDFINIKGNGKKL